jgi:pyruvate/2-oxoglutarate/acetoin dehydrogenase E1 component
MTYKNELTRAMEYLAQDKNVLFLGQTAEYSGSGMHSTLENIAESQKLELPIIEDTQMGMSIGLSLKGYIPVSIFPRFDFFLCATNQLVNHLDKIAEMSHNEFEPAFIIRTSVGSTKPLYPGLQHCSDYTEMFKAGLKNIDVIKLTKPRKIFHTYKKAYENVIKNRKSSLIIEVCDLYNQE